MNEYEKFDGVPDECLGAADWLPVLVLGIALVVLAAAVFFL